MISSLLLQMKGRPYDIRGDKVIEEPPTVQITPGLRSSSSSAEPMASLRTGDGDNSCCVLRRRAAEHRKAPGRNRGDEPGGSNDKTEGKTAQ